jgi:hypothetical protein
MPKRERKTNRTVKRAANEEDRPALDPAGGITWEEQQPERGGEAGGGRNVDRHDRSRDREVDEPTI